MPAWDHLASALQPDFCVIALDQRGHGDSQWAPGGHTVPGAQPEAFAVAVRTFPA